MSSPKSQTDIITGWRPSRFIPQTYKLVVCEQCSTNWIPTRSDTPFFSCLSPLSFSSKLCLTGCEGRGWGCHKYTTCVFFSSWFFHALIASHPPKKQKNKKLATRITSPTAYSQGDLGVFKHKSISSSTKTGQKISCKYLCMCCMVSNKWRLLLNKTKKKNQKSNKTQIEFESPRHHLPWAISGTGLDPTSISSPLPITPAGPGVVVQHREAGWTLSPQVSRDGKPKVLQGL